MFTSKRKAKSMEKDNGKSNIRDSMEEIVRDVLSKDDTDSSTRPRNVICNFVSVSEAEDILDEENDYFVTNDYDSWNPHLDENGDVVPGFGDKYDDDDTYVDKSERKPPTSDDGEEIYPF